MLALVTRANLCSKNLVSTYFIQKKRIGSAYNSTMPSPIELCTKEHGPLLTLKLPGPYAGMGGPLTVTVA